MVLYMAFMQRKLELSGIEAMVLRTDDSTQGWLGRTFRHCIAAYLALVLIDYFAPQWIEMHVGSVPMFDHEFVAVLGAFLMIVGTCVVLWGQYSLGLAWRIGIKENDSPTFIQTGAFRCSRNPVFSGILASRLATHYLIVRFFPRLCLPRFTWGCTLKCVRKKTTFGASLERSMLLGLQPRIGGLDDRFQQIEFVC